MLKLFSGTSLASVAVSAIAGAGVTAYPIWSTAHNAGYGKAEKSFTETEDRFFQREAVLWFEVGAARQAQAEMADHFVTVIDGTEEARRAARAGYLAEKKRADKAVQWAADALGELDRVQNDWKGKLVPPDVIRPLCVRDGQSGCDPAPSGAASSGSVEIRGEAASSVRADKGMPNTAGADAAGGDGGPVQ